MNGSLGAELSEVDATLLRATGSYGTEKYDLFVSGSYFERDAYKLPNHDALAKTHRMAKQKFRPTRPGVFSGAKAYI